MMKERESTWTAEKIKQLKKLWSKGKSTVEIGRELGISKNAVVGKVHRLELNARPSPIKKEAVKTVKHKAEKPSKMTLMDLKLNSCRWPVGEPKDADFHFCGKDTVTGKPYCQEHCKVAYTSLKELANQNKTPLQNQTDFDDDKKTSNEINKKQEKNIKTETKKISGTKTKTSSKSPVKTTKSKKK